MGDRRCCCPAGCIVLWDEFDRSASTDLGADWTEEVGDSEIISIMRDGVASLELEVPAAGVVVTVDDTGEVDPYMRVSAICRDIQVGDIYRVLCNVDLTPLIYYYAEIEILASNVLWLRVGSNSGMLNEVELTWDTLGDDMDLIACRTEEGLYGSTGIAGAEPYSTSAWDCVSDNGGRQAGLMNASATADVEFDDFEFLRGFDVDGARCFYCDCECEGQCLSDTLVMTFTATGYCSCLDGVEIEVDVIKGDDIIKWAGTASVYNLQCAVQSTASFRLECDWGNKQFTLYDVNQHPGGDGWTAGPPYYAVPISVQCDPLIIVFPANGIGDTFAQTITPPCPPGGCDCFYTITITEA